MKRKKLKNAAPTAKIKGEKAVRLTGYICGAIIFLLFFSYFLRQFVFPEGATTRIFAAAVSACALLPLLIYPLLKRRLPRFAYGLLCIYTALALFFCVTFVIHLWDTLFFPAESAEASELEDGAVVLVFGSKIQGTQPAPPLKKRLDMAVAVLSERPDLICIVAGGQGDDEIMPEGEAMRNYLISAGIAAERVIAETKSRNTIANIANSKAIMADMGLEGRQVACISSSFHIPRIGLLMERAGFENVCYFPAPSPTPASLFFSLIREYCSRAKIIFG